MSCTLSVLGLTFKMIYRSVDPSESSIGGPALLSSVGVRLQNQNLRLFTRLPKDLTSVEKRLLAFLDKEYELNSLEIDNYPTWSGNRILGVKPLYKVRGDLCKMRVSVDPAYIDKNFVIFSGGDPAWCAEVLRGQKPQFLSIDIGGDWIPIRQCEFQTCLKSANLVTVTESDYVRMSAAFSHVRCGFQPNTALVIKRGHRGISVLCSGDEIELPPPRPRAVTTDVGAGDLLLGLLSGKLAVSGFRLTPHSVCQAYEESRNYLAEFLESEDVISFLRTQKHGLL